MAFGTPATTSNFSHRYNRLIKTPDWISERRREVIFMRRWSRLALSGHSRHRNKIDAIGQERTNIKRSTPP
jgi:hypothetical protein